MKVALEQAKSPALPRIGLIVLVLVIALAAGFALRTEQSDPLPAPPVLAPSSPANITVGVDGAFRSVADALDNAKGGDVIEVQAGHYEGPVIVNKPVTLQGAGHPVIDAGGKGSVITVEAPGAIVRGFKVVGSGANHDNGDAGIMVRAGSVTIEDNVLEDVLYGVSLDNSPKSIIRNNRISGKDISTAERGDGIRLWYSSGVLVADNVVVEGRDSVIWYSNDIRFERNRVERGRYGLHLMFADHAVLEDNVLRDNSVGAYLMYSKSVDLRHNLLAANRGPSGYGLGLKDVDNITVNDNWLVDNRVGMWIDNSPREIDAIGRVERNVFAVNDIGVAFLPSVERNVFVQNVFRDNLQQVSVQGGGALKGNHWEQDGMGNYWTDYRGFDSNSDGIGDVPYRSEALVDSLFDREPVLRFFQIGPAASIVEFIASAAPILKPAPKLTDAAPLMSPPVLGMPPGQTPVNPAPALGLAVTLLAAAVGVLSIPRARIGRKPLADERTDIAPVLSIAGLTKSYGRHVVLDGLSFDVAPGEAVAIWGPNGAGKTTVLKCLLGLIPCGGSITLGGRDALRDGKVARRALGYVPQDVAFDDGQTVAETMKFYARLRRVSGSGWEALVENLGLSEHVDKPVGALSGGLRQRLAIALALMSQPSLLVLDEPTSNLDAAGRELIVRLLEEQRDRGASLLFTSHRLEDVMHLANRVVVLDRNRGAVICSPAELPDLIGLRVRVVVRVAASEDERAEAILRSGGLAPERRYAGLYAFDLPHDQKLQPIRLLERAGVAVADYTVERDFGENGD